ncbi:ABC transporter substrate-binding protein [Nonomuraea gerenzanensis]|uniref:N-Acetyl-D-glucosamine ABC transport system, sugar-binding protein n=1 Tax=Nonomuraea gerenzanensis TaxID=93944 RepID=A0A1M4E6J8_9ACTN|nr:sugar ABC transporter substrate-binding protein [Nonomuraea gerenzanensis]UBU16585.1 sugar ABC transporter substrate-binding protein [Nonomuraea gerenzanensis]SBO94412.1 N-Acetyl-D-glucosamine ABC transport system, sugar-binding protein [Nonomuraea gerenzanensis]
MRFRLPLAGLLGLTVLAAGCGSSGETAADGKVTISYAIWDKNDQPSSEKIIAAFQQANPNVTVKLEVTPWEQYWTKLQTAASGGVTPDVFWMNSLNVRMYAKGGIIAPVEEPKAAGLPGAVVDGYRYDGKLYALPHHVSIPALWYNKQLFKEAGVEPPTADWTWDDVKAAAEKLTDPGKQQFGILAPMLNQVGYYNTMLQAGGQVISPDGKRSGFGDPASVQGLEFWTGLIEEKTAPAAEVYGDTDPIQLFQSGKYGMFYGGIWFASTYWADPAFRERIDVAPLPKGPAREAVILLGLANAVSAKTEHPKEAAAFAEFIASEQAQKIISDSAGGALSLRPGTQDGWFKAFPSFHLKETYDASMPHGVPYPVSLNTAQWQEAETRLLADAWAGKRPVADAAKEIAVQMNEILAKE